MALSCHDPLLTEHQQIQLYITSLGNPLHTDVALQQLAPLDDAVIFAWVYVQRNASQEVAPTQHQRQPSCTPFKPPLTTAALTEGGASGATTIETLRLTPAKIAQRRKDGRCFHYHDMFTNGHKKVCKQLFIIEVIGEDDEPPLPNDTEEPTISLHTLTGICPRSGRTMQLVVTINGICLTTLLDSGSTHNFVDVEAAAHAGIQLGAPSGLHMSITNGDRIPSLGCYRHMPLSITDELFVIDCYDIALGSHEIVLGLQWLESLGPILWDFSHRIIQFVSNGHTVC
jgi:hypothetical protein